MSDFMIDWKEFESIYGDKLDKAFEDLTYHLFCYEFNESKYIFRFHNQKAIETDPVKNGDDYIGFQTKIYSVKDNINKFKDTIKDVKETYPELTKLIFYSYREIGQNFDNEGNKPEYMIDIEECGKKYGIEVDWRVKSQLENMLLKSKNILILYRFFSDNYEDIHTLDTFLTENKNRYRPDLSNPYFKIKTVHNEIIEKIKANEILSISGHQGIGKTRLAVEIGKYLQNEKDYNVVIIDYPNQDLLYKLKKIVQIDEPYLFIFDNFTNNYDDLYHIIDKLSVHCQNKFAKFLFTMKNQYVNDLNKILDDFKYIENYELFPMTDAEMWNIIRKISIEGDYSLSASAIKKFVQIAKGNVGIARMVLDSIEENDLHFVDSYYYIYEKYFEKSKLSQLNVNKKILGIMSFFDEIDLSDDNLLNEISELFDCDLRDESETITTLIDNEILDLNESTVILSDSILSTYLFYLIFVKEEILSLKNLISNYIPNNARKINDKIYDMLNVFGIESLNEIKTSQLNSLKSDLNGSPLVLFYIIFYIYYAPEIIGFMKEWINKLNSEEFNIDKFKIPEKHEITTTIDEIVLLSRLFYTEFQTLGLQLSMKLIMKKPSLTKDVLWSITQSHAYTHSSTQNDFDIQNKFMDYVESNDFSDEERVVIDRIFLFILSENRLLSWKHMTQTYLNSMIPQPLELTISPNESAKKFRLRLLNYMFSLCDMYPSEIEKILDQYIKNIYDSNPIIEGEEEIIYKIFDKLNFDTYKPNKLCYEYLNRMKKNSIKLSFNFEKFLNHALLEKVSLLSNSLNRREDNFYERDLQIREYLSNHDFDYGEMLKLIEEIRNNEKNVRTYCDAFFKALIEIDLNEFQKALNHYMENNLNILESYIFLNTLFKKITGLQCYKLINNHEYADKIHMKYFYYEFLPEKSINKTILKNLIEFIKEDSKHANINEFDKYCKFNSQFLKIKNELDAQDIANIIQYLTKILIETFDKTPIMLDYNFCEDNIKYFKNNTQLIENLYLKSIAITNYDKEFNELKVLYESDKEFLIKYFNYRFEHNDEFYKDSSKIDFIWEEYDYNYIEKVVKLIIENYSLDACCLRLLFSNTHEQEIRFIDEFIKKHCENEKYMRKIFEIIRFEFGPLYCDFLEKLLKLNDDYELFGLIMAPYFQIKLYNKKYYYKDEIEFYKEIQTMLANSENPIRYTDHISLIGELIQKNEENYSNVRKNLKR